MQQIASGSVGEVPVKCGRMAELMPTACFERIDDLRSLELSDAPLATRMTRPTVLSEPGKQRPLDPTAELAIDITAASRRSWLGWRRPTIYTSRSSCSPR